MKQKIYASGYMTGREQRLSSRIAGILSVILLVIFSCMVGTAMILSRNGMSSTIGDEFRAMARGTGAQVQNILRSAETSAETVSLYIQNEFKPNQVSIPGEQSEHISIIYKKAIGEKSYEAEQYITQFVRQTVRSNDDIVGMGVLFEPYAFDQNIRDYAFFITKETADQPIQPYGNHSDYSAQEYYVQAAQTKSPYITKPYDDAGYKMVTYCMPVVYNSQLLAVITADINVSDFSQIVYETEKYDSKYTTVIDNDGIVIFDTESIDNIGANLKNFIVDKDALSRIETGMRGTEMFTAEVIREDGTRETSYYYPVINNQTKWWTITALDKSDMNHSTTVITIALVVVAVISLVIAVVVVTWLVRRMLKPIESVVEAAEQIAQGNLDIHLETRSRDEIGRLVTAFSATIDTLQCIIKDESYILREIAAGNLDVKSEAEDRYVGDFVQIRDSLSAIIEGLNHTMQQILQSSEQVSSGSEQVSFGAQALSQGATEQASSVEELAATISEISVQVQGTAENAVAAREQMVSAESETMVCNEQMREMIQAMGEISQRSTEIGKIIKTIEDIAFQTNILALNAAVEAARAGTAGKGFAVVADEVRNLASKSAEASNSTSALIEGSIAAVAKGTKIANETAQSLSKVVDSSQTVSATVEKISDAASAQAISIAQVTQGIDQISSVVQTNSATAEESAAASEELSGQAQMLKSLVGRFKLKDEDSVPSFTGQTSGAPMSTGGKYEIKAQ